MNINPNLVIIKSWNADTEKRKQRAMERADLLIDTIMKSQHAPKRRKELRVFFDGNTMAVVGTRSVMVRLGLF